jgi:hypothetical protein
MIEIEFSEPKRSTCECCGGESTSLTRFVYDDGAAFAVYYAAFSSDHPERGLLGIVSLGDWGEDGVPPSRVVFAFEMWANEENFNVQIIDAAQSPWKNSKIIGRKLTRDEALAHPWIDDVFHITDHMTDDDPEVKAFFQEDTVH